MSIVVASYGGGVNSTAMLIGMAERQEHVDLILFADTGGEKPETYSYVRRFAHWLVNHGMPPIREVGRKGTLEQECLDANTLPSIVFGDNFRSCSDKFKQQPQRNFVRDYVNEHGLAWPVTRLIGFDAGEAYRANPSPEKRYVNRYPLIEWQWGRDECVAAITRVGLCVPAKSSCFFCPNMGEDEILDLRDNNPELFARAVEMERNSREKLVTIKGLARDYSWEQIANYDAAQLALLPKRVRDMPCGCYDGGTE